MIGYLARRTAASFGVLLGAMTVIFVVVRMLPGDPVANLMGAGASEEEIARARTDLGLDRPLLEQYLSFMLNALRLDFGESIRLSGSALHNVVERLPISALLACTAVAIAFVVGVPLGVAAARNVNRLTDRVISTVVMAGQAMPTFWVGLVLILVFSRHLGLLPSAGAAGPAHLLLPSVTLAVPLVSLITRLVRSGLVEAFEQPYVTTARSKGVAEWRIVYQHALPNVMLPVVTVVGLELGSLLGGTVIVEIVFSWPGVGRLLIDGIGNRDFTVVQAAVTAITAIFVVMNLLVDLLYTRIDPRIRLDAGERV